jgi:hypothetical protein
VISGKLMVGSSSCRCSGSEATWALRRLEAYLVPWREGYRVG